MRTALLFLVSCVTLAASNAQANYTIDLLWADTGTTLLPASLALDPGLAVNPTCKGQNYAGPEQGHCLTVQLRADAPFKAALITLGWHAGDSGRSFRRWSGTTRSSSPRSPAAVGSWARGCSRSRGESRVEAVAPGGSATRQVRRRQVPDRVLCDPISTHLEVEV